MRANVFSQHHALVKCTWTHRARVGLLAGMNAFVFTQSTTVGKCFPAETTTIRSLTSVNSNVNLLGAARAEGLTAFAAWKLPSRHAAMAMTMVHQRAPIGEVLTADVALHRFVSVRQHVALQARLVVERLRALRARECLLFGVLQAMRQQRTAILADPSAVQASILRQVFAVLGLYVRRQRLLISGGIATEIATELRCSRVNFSMREQIQRLGEILPAHVTNVQVFVIVGVLGLDVHALMAFELLLTLERHAASLTEELAIFVIIFGELFVLIEEIVLDAIVFVLDVLTHCIRIPKHFTTSPAFEWAVALVHACV